MQLESCIAIPDLPFVFNEPKHPRIHNLCITFQKLMSFALGKKHLKFYVLHHKISKKSSIVIFLTLAFKVTIIDAYLVHMLTSCKVLTKCDHLDHVRSSHYSLPRFLLLPKPAAPSSVCFSFLSFCVLDIKTILLFLCLPYLLSHLYVSSFCPFLSLSFISLYLESNQGPHRQALHTELHPSSLDLQRCFFSFC